MADNTPTPQDLRAARNERASTNAKNASTNFTYIEARIADLYSVEKLDQQLERSAILDQKTYLKLYAAIQDYTTASKAVGRGSGQHRGAHLLGEDVYRILLSRIRACCRDVHEQVIKSGEKEEILAAYVTYWTSYLTLSELASNVFRYLERHWVKREMDETQDDLVRKKRELYEIPQLHMVMWREEVLNVKGPTEEGVQWESGGEVLKAFLAIQQQSESEQHVQATLASFDKLGLALSGDSLVVL